MQSKGLNDAISQQNGDAIHNGIALSATLAPDSPRLKL
jgi:hypothetical protein